MLRIRGARKRLCDGITRRDLLTAGSIGLLGLGLDDLFRAQQAGAAEIPAAGDRSFGKAKSCILLYLYGSPSHIEFCDPKPTAPVEVRGEFGTIRTNLPGCDVCELLPKTARVMDRVTIVRSLEHDYPIHSISYALTGIPSSNTPLDLNARDPRHWPFIGSVVEYLHRDKKPGSVPDNIAMPFEISTKRPAALYAGFQPAFLGSAHAPIWTDFKGTATHRAVRIAMGNNPPYEGPDPYLGMTPDSRVEIVGASSSAAELTLDRLDRRRSLLDQFSRGRRDLDDSEVGRGMDRYRQMAYSLISSTNVRSALDVGREPRPLREAYGMNLFGQSTLIARRLIEAGCRFTTVTWDEYGTFNTAWDTHCKHFERMKGELMPAFDMAYSSLINDLDARGLLDETLVLVLSEHGRTPKITPAPGGGREHWSRCYSAMLAGGGIARGRVVGRSDKIGGAVVERPMSPKDILATVYHLLGIDPQTTLTGPLGRPLPLLTSGQVPRDILA